MLVRILIDATVVSILIYTFVTMFGTWQDKFSHDKVCSVDPIASTNFKVSISFLQHKLGC